MILIAIDIFFENVNQGIYIEIVGNWNAFTIIRSEPHTCRFRAFVIQLLSLKMFSLYEIRHQCRYVLSNLATGQRKRNWHARNQFFISSNQIRVTLSERVSTDTEQL